MKNLILLLIGQKGSGKTFIGSLLEKKFAIRFVRVEDWAKEIKRDRSIDDKSYLDEVFKKIEAGVRKVLKDEDKICFESTGVTTQFDTMLESLKRDYKVVSIKINCDPEVCFSRVRNRNKQLHINVSDEDLKRINEAVIKRNFIADIEIDNRAKSEEELSLELHKIISLI